MENKNHSNHRVVCASCDFETFIATENPPERFICEDCQELVSHLAMWEEMGLAETAASD